VLRSGGVSLSVLKPLLRRFADGAAQVFYVAGPRQEDTLAFIIRGGRSITGRFIVEGVFWIRARVAASYPEK
jgi:hypothetical protein